VPSVLTTPAASFVPPMSTARYPSPAVAEGPDLIVTTPRVMAYARLAASLVLGLLALTLCTYFL
jgi:hypothetical protein